MAPHTGSATPEQIDTLLNFLDDHKDLARGRLRSIEGKVQAKLLWEELCNILNSMGGCTKTIQQWQKVWFDRKHLAKKAAADSRRSASATGGGPSMAPPLSQWELKVISIMGDGFGGRQHVARVPAFGETYEPIPSTSSSQASQPPEEVLEYVELGEELSQPRQLSKPARLPPVSQEPSSSGHSSQPTHPRRQSAAQSTRPGRSHSDDVTSRLFQFEEGRAEREAVRNTELAGIRPALLQLCRLMRLFR